MSVFEKDGLQRSLEMWLKDFAFPAGRYRTKDSLVFGSLQRHVSSDTFYTIPTLVRELSREGNVSIGNSKICMTLVSRVCVSICKVLMFDDFIAETN